MRRMSFSRTTEAICNRTKTVTRRRMGTWDRLRRGDRLLAVERTQGLKKGEKHNVLAEIRIVSVKAVAIDEPLDRAELDREGCGHMAPEEFHALLRELFGGLAYYCKRIEFEYVDE